MLTNIYELEKMSRQLPAERVYEAESAHRAELAAGRTPGEGSGEPIARRPLTASPLFGRFANRIGNVLRG